MRGAITTSVDPVARRGEPWYKNRKLDQLICFWSVPVFYSLFGLIFVPLSWMMPPRSPANTMPAIVEFMQSPNLLTACALLVLALGLSAVGNAVYLSQMHRMSVSPVFRFAFMAGAMTGAIVGCLFPMFCFGLGAFRPGYDPEILALLYDFGYLAFIGCMGCFFLNWSCLSLAILLDENNILPRWVGYYTAWQAVTELFVATVWIAKVGPFAWDGLLAFWFNMVLYVPWQIIVYICIYRAIKNQPENLPSNARPAPEAAYA